jgi:hypothetical protein
MKVSDFIFHFFLHIFTILRGFRTSAKKPPQDFRGFSPSTSGPQSHPQLICGNRLSGSFGNSRKTVGGG